MSQMMLLGCGSSGGGESYTPPVNTVPPALDDTTPLVGQELGASEGTWNGTPTSFVWLWYRDGADIAVTTEAYVVTSDDIGCVLKRSTVASNAAGDSEPVFSDETSAILSNDTSLSAFTYDGNGLSDAGTQNLGAEMVGASLDLAVITPTHAGAVVNALTLTPDPLVLGDNALTFDVNAEDGTVRHYSTTLHVLTAGVAEITEAIFPAAFIFITGGAGKALIISTASERIAFWANTGTESQPSLASFNVTQYVVVSVNSGDDDTVVAAAFEPLISLAGFEVAQDGHTLTITDPAVGVRVDAEQDGGVITVSVTQQGENPV